MVKRNTIWLSITFHSYLLHVGCSFAPKPVVTQNRRSGTATFAFSDESHTHSFIGKHKWLGGAVDSEGSIYGIPSNAKDIICLYPNRDSKDYKIKLMPLPDEVANGKFKWLRGIICDDYLYGIPAWSKAGVLKLDLAKLWGRKRAETSCLDNAEDNAPLISTLPIPNTYLNHNDGGPTRWLWHGAALNANRTAIYAIPSNAEHVLKVDLKSSSTSLLPIPLSSTPLNQTNKWYGGILGQDNAVYGVPYASSGVLRIDANTDQVEIIGDYGVKEYNWHGGILADNGAIYCFPSHNANVLRIDTNIGSSKDTRKLSLLPIERASYDNDEETRYKWLGGAIGADSNIYGMPSDASSILRIDTKNERCTTFGTVSGEKNKWQGGVLSTDNGHVYAIPSNSRHILRIDTNKHESCIWDRTKVSMLGDLPPSKDKWQGGFVGGQGDIFCIPENFDKVMKVMLNGDSESISYL